MRKLYKLRNISSMVRQIFILLSILLVISPVTSAFSADLGSGSMDHSDDARCQMDSLPECAQAIQNQIENDCSHDRQCNSKCVSMYCSSVGKLSALSFEDSFEPGYITLSLMRSGLFKEPVTVFSDTPLRPPIMRL